MGFYGICSHILPAEEKKRRTVKAGAKTDRSLEGSGEEITWQKGNRLTDRPGRVPPGMASRAHRGRQEACVGGPHMEATFAAVRRETKSKRSMREDSCPEHQWEKMQLDPLKGKKQKGKGRSCQILR